MLAGEVPDAPRVNSLFTPGAVPYISRTSARPCSWLQDEVGYVDRVLAVPVDPRERDAVAGVEDSDQRIAADHLHVHVKREGRGGDAERRDVEQVLAAAARVGVEAVHGVGAEAWSEHEDVVVRASVHRVVAGAARETVGACTAAEDVDPGAADEAVVAGSAGQAVVTRAAVNRVVAVSTAQRIVAAAARDRIVESVARAVEVARPDEGQVLDV